MRRMSGFVAAWAALALAGCPGDSPSGGADAGALTCEEFVETCAPLYQPTFDNVFQRTLVSTCGVAGVSCHAAEGNQGGLAFADADQAHALLLAGRVVAGDACASLLVDRIEATDSSRMPPGATPLPEGERCAIEQWIAAGAER